MILAMQEIKNIDLDKPLWTLTGREFLDLMQHHLPKEIEESKKENRHIVHGIPGIASIFNCSISTAQRIKSSGKIDKAISQFGRTIVVDVDLALELFNTK